MCAQREFASMNLNEENWRTSGKLDFINFSAFTHLHFLLSRSETRLPSWHNIRVLEFNIARWRRALYKWQDIRKRKQSIECISLKVKHRHTIWYASSGSVDESNVKSPKSTKPDSLGWNRTNKKNSLVAAFVREKERRVERRDSPHYRTLVSSAGEINIRKRISSFTDIFKRWLRSRRRGRRRRK